MRWSNNHSGRRSLGMTMGLAASCLLTLSTAFVPLQPSHRTLGSLGSSICLDRALDTSVDRDAYLVRDFHRKSPPTIDSLALLSATGEPPSLVTLKQEETQISLLETAQPISTSHEQAQLLHDKISFPPTSTTTKSSSTSTLLRWKRRLVTREDWKHTHKITGILFLMSSWGLAGYGIRDLLAHGWTQPVTCHGKPFVTLLLVLLSSSVLQSFSSFSMACRYRRNQPAVRNTFLCNAAVAILGSVSALWSSPWYPTALNGAPSMAFYLIMDAIGLIGMGDNLVRLQALIASRQTRKHDNNNNSLKGLAYWKDVLVYMMPILIGAPFFVAIGWQFGIQHDRTFYLNLLASQEYPHLQAGAVYGMVMVAMGASYSSLIVTLRDKKLIRKRTEGLSLMAVMLCLIGSLYQAMKDPGTIAALVGF